MDKIQQQIIAFLKGLSARQRIVLSGSVMLVAGTVWLFVILLDAGEYKPLYTAMAPPDAQQLGQRLAAGRGHDSVMTTGNQELETLLAERVVQMLGPVVGADHVKSSITIDYDQTSGESTQELYDPTNPVLLSSQTSNTPAATPAPEVSAAAANGPAANANTQTKSKTTTPGMHTETKTFAVSKTTHRTLEPAGRIRRVAAAILVDDAVETKADGSGKLVATRRKRTPEEMKQMENLAKAAVGYNAQRGDQFSLENILFVMPEMEVPPPPGKIQTFAGYAERWAGWLRYAGLFALFLVMYFLLLRPVKKQVLHILQGPRGGQFAEEETAKSALLASATGAIVAAGGELPEVTEAMVLKKELVARVKEDPQAAGRVIEAWMREI
jgi:flagellar M-ring protein FliF